MATQVRKRRAGAKVLRPTRALHAGTAACGLEIRSTGTRKSRAAAYSITSSARASSVDGTRAQTAVAGIGNILSPLLTEQLRSVMQALGKRSGSKSGALAPREHARHGARSLRPIIEERCGVAEPAHPPTKHLCRAAGENGERRSAVGPLPPNAPGPGRGTHARNMWWLWAVPPSVIPPLKSHRQVV
jgi:hypothetical protein